ncbi:sensor histidine kinase [Microbacterium murale]|uniref:histidine kinase n=1 Tax=Microbacterium murale TaxID=1081040 RepID=A0ABU0PD42_9MICO|nr:ATP-binding protein [Microbacterium murale]MDQ0645235.1 two-component system CitB family sensor kinase [Microbacterium murale]
MTRSERSRSAASHVFVVLLIAAILAGVLAAIVLALQTQRASRVDAEQLTSALAQSIADSPSVIEALDSEDAESASAALQPYATAVVDHSALDFITVMTATGSRVTHPDPTQLGAQYRGTIPATQTTLTEEFTGTLGASVRTITPVLNSAGEGVGWVAAGVTVESIAESFLGRLPSAFGISALIVAAGSLGAFLARRYTRRIAGDLPAGQVRDAVASYESVRTLGEALRAQTHEHGNRMHTAIALLELGRTSEAIDILAETSQQSQSLVDQVTARRDGDPTVGALLLGKASQAKERGVDWTAVIAPDAPRSALAPMDSIAVLGNLIDNALDAAAAAAERWIRVEVRPAREGWVVLEVSDSGAGIPVAAREQIFQHGFSTKPAGTDGRGVGLALVRSIVNDVGGTVEIEDGPTKFRVTLPGASESGASGKGPLS